MIYFVLFTKHSVKYHEEFDGKMCEKIFCTDYLCRQRRHGGKGERNLDNKNVKVVE